MTTTVAGNASTEFAAALGIVPPAGKDWTVHATILSEGGEHEAVMQVYGGALAFWTHQIRTADGYTNVEDGAVLDGSAELGAPAPASPLAIPQYLVAIATSTGVPWDLATIRCGGNRALAKQLRVWLEATLAASSG